MEFYFRVFGRIQPKQRPRFSGGHTYTPKPTQDYEKKIREAFIGEYGGNVKPLSGAIEMVLNCYVEIPKSKPKKVKEKMLMGEIRPTTRTGDIDNLFKVYADALNEVAYDDDSQIVVAVINKWYAEEPKAEITIREVRNGQS